MTELQETDNFGINESPLFETNEKPEDLKGLSLPYEKKSVNEIIYPKAFSKRWWMYNVVERENLFLYLTLLGIIVGLLGQGTDTVIEYISQGHIYVSRAAYYWPLKFLVWISYQVGFVCFSMFMVAMFAPCAGGSGVPEIKVCFSGILMKDFLSFKTLIIKIITLVSILGCNQPLGKEGPFSHIGVLVANNLLKVPIVFRKLLNDPVLRLFMLEAGSAAGIAGNFSAPLGGLLFSIEATSNLYHTRNYFPSLWAAFWAAFASRMIFSVRKNTPLFSAYAQTTFSSSANLQELKALEIITSLALGVFTAAVGVLFCKYHAIIVYFRRLVLFKIFGARERFLYGLFCAIVAAIVIFPDLIGDYMALLPTFALKDLVNSGSLNYKENKTLFAKDWDAISIYLSLPLFGFGRFVLTGLSASCPIPAGILVPGFLYGASAGRFMGSLINGSLNKTPALPAMYACIGAVGCASAITQCFSTTVLFFEITGQLMLLIPSLICSVSSIAISRKLTYNFYDLNLVSKKVPYLPEIVRHKTYILTAADVMEVDLKKIDPFLPKHIHYSELMGRITENKKTDDFVIVEDEESRKSLGVISRSKIDDFLETYREEKAGKRLDPPQLVQSWFCCFVNFVRDIRPHYQGRSYTDDEKKLFEDYIDLPVDGNLITFHTNAEMRTIHSIFAVLKLKTGFVGENGRIVGYITRDNLRRIIQKNRTFYEIDPNNP